MKVQFLTESQRIRPVSYDEIAKMGKQVLFSDREIGTVTTHYLKDTLPNAIHADIEFSVFGERTHDLPMIEIMRRASRVTGPYDWVVFIFPPRSVSRISPIIGRNVSNLDEESAIELFDKVAAYILKNLDTTDYDSFWGSLIDSMHTAAKKFGFR